MSTVSVSESYAELKSAAEEKYNALQDTPVIMVGTASCGKAAGADKVKEAFEEEIRAKGLDARVVEVGCMGHCYAEPLAVVSKPGFPGLCYANLDEGFVKRLVDDFLINDDPCYEYAMVALEPNEVFPTFSDFPRGVYEHKIVLEHCGFIDPGDIDQYIVEGGYEALSRALEMTPEEVMEEINESGLRGRGGAGFPAAEKWEVAREAPGDVKYIIANGDEGDPGAFMDRGILESNPHLVLEGLIISAYAIGAQEAYFYIRAEYPQAVERTREAIRQAKEKGLVGPSILGSDYDLDVKIFQGSGAFICGESSALVKSMEGHMGMPEQRPPRLSISGYRGKPTVVNNVKTLGYVPHILRKGAEWFRGIGNPDSPGTVVFALVGKVNNTGLVEVPMGTTLRQLIYDVGEGIPGDKQFKAVQIGGPSGGCLPESALDIPIDFDSLREAGAMMGSGGLVVLDEDDCMVSVAHFFLDFTQKESCGKCTFCRLGTKHMLDILERITRGEEEDLKVLDHLQELAEDVRAGSLCNLGRTAPNPILTTLRYFRDEYEAHITERCCPARMCPDLITFYIEPPKCSKLCSVCVGSCPTEAIYTREDGLKAIDQEKCVKCNNCYLTCPPEYLAVVKLSPPELLEEKEGKSS